MELSALSNSKEILRCQTINLIKYLINAKEGRKRETERQKLDKTEHK